MIISNDFYSTKYNYFPIKFSANPQKVVRQTASKVSFDDAMTEILGLFNKTPEQLLSHHSPIVSKGSNRILGISVKTKKGNDLTITKVMGTNVRQGLKYLSFVEKNSKGKRGNTISIDLENNEFLKLGTDNKPIVKDDNVHYYSLQELKTKGISKKFNDYFGLIFNNAGDDVQKQSAVFLNNKSSNKIAETKVEDAVDLNLFRQLDNEYKDEFTVINTDETPNIDYIV